MSIFERANEVGRLDELLEKRDQFDWSLKLATGTN